TAYGWAAGDSGVVIHTTNAGANWSILPNGIPDDRIDDIFFLNRRLGWTISVNTVLFQTTILKTTNGGINWTGGLFPDTTKIFNTIYFTDSLNGYIGGYSGVIYKTTNSGFTWFPTYIDTN